MDRILPKETPEKTYEDRFKEVVEERLSDVERRLVYLEQVLQVQQRKT